MSSSVFIKESSELSQKESLSFFAQISGAVVANFDQPMLDFQRQSPYDCRTGPGEDIASRQCFVRFKSSELSQKWLLRIPL